jgi:IS605 OrfB family transposase
MKTVPVKLRCCEEDKAYFLSILKEKQACFNFLSKELYELEWNRFLSIKKLHDRFYYALKERFPNLLTQILIKVEQEVLATYKSIKSNRHQIDKAPEQRCLCLQLDKRLYSHFTKTSIALPGNKGEKRKQIDFILYDRARDFLEHNTPHDPKLYVKGNKLYIAIPFDVACPAPENEDLLGIDLGIRCMASCSDGRVYKCNDFKKEKRRLKYLRRCLQAGKTKSAKRHLRKNGRKIANYSKDYVHKLANELLKTKADVIVLEDLKKIKERTKFHKRTKIKRTAHNRVFGDIPIALLASMLAYKASHLGKMVATVDPAYTSQDDCRGLDRGKRQGRRYYGIDGVQLDADINASVNIANRYLWNNKILVEKHPASYPETRTYAGRLPYQPANRG